MNDFKINQIKHLIDLEGQKERVVLQIEKIINELNQLIIEKINPENKTRSETLRELDVLINTYFRKLDNDLRELLIELGLYESDFYVDLINFNKNKNFKKITKEESSSLLLFVLLGSSLKESLTTQKNNLKININREVNTLYSNTSKESFKKASINKNLNKKIDLNSNNTDINIINNSINNIKSKLNTNKAQLNTLVRTATTNQLESSKIETLKKNNVAKYQYVAILDSQTTPICKRLHNKVFNIKDKNSPKPPMHFNCRSSIVPFFTNEDKFTKEDTLKEFSKISGNKRNIDKDGKFKLNNNDIISLKERKKRDKNII